MTFTRTKVIQILSTSKKNLLKASFAPDLEANILMVSTMAFILLYTFFSTRLKTYYFFSIKEFFHKPIFFFHKGRSS